MLKKTLKNKEEYVLLNFNNLLQITYLWNSDNDRDLCVFWKTKNSEEGGVLSQFYTNNIDSIGCADKFPYIKWHEDDLCTPSNKSIEEVLRYNMKIDVIIPPANKLMEKITIHNIDTMSELYVVIVDYQHCLIEKRCSFDGRVDLMTDTDIWIEIPVEKNKVEPIFIPCKIENNDNGIKVIKKGCSLTIKQAFDQIPGFKLICN